MPLRTPRVPSHPVPAVLPPSLSPLRVPLRSPSTNRVRRASHEEIHETSFVVVERFESSGPDGRAAGGWREISRTYHAAPTGVYSDIFPRSVFAVRQQREFLSFRGGEGEGGGGGRRSPFNPPSPNPRGKDFHRWPFRGVTGVIGGSAYDRRGIIRAYNAIYNLATLGIYYRDVQAHGAAPY